MRCVVGQHGYGDTVTAKREAVVSGVSAGVCVVCDCAGVSLMSVCGCTRALLDAWNNHAVITCMNSWDLLQILTHYLTLSIIL